MVGKTVKINKELLSIFYPNYKMLEYVNGLNKYDDVIYIGKPFNNLKGYLEKNTKSFINTVGPPDIDLSTKESLMEYVLKIKGKTVTNKFKEFVQLVDDKEFYYCIKIYHLTGRLPYDLDKTSSFYELYKALNENTSKVIQVFLSLCKTYPLPLIEASILSFLNRVANNQIEGVSKKYALIINNTRAKVNNKLKPSIINYSQSNQNELDLLALLLNLIS